MSQNVQMCIKKLNKNNFYSKSKTIFINKFINSLHTIKNYEKEFYSTQQLYSKENFYEIKNELAYITQTVKLKNNYKTLDCWDIKTTNGKYIIFFSGIGINKSCPLSQELYIRFSQAGYGILTFDYSGCGKSDGSFSKNCITKNAQEVYEYLKNKGITKDNIILVGHSFGCSVALDLAYKENFPYIILINPFNKSTDMVKNIAKNLDIPKFVKETIYSLPDFLLPIKNNFDNEKSITKTKAKILLIHNKQDETIPINLFRKLCNKTKKLAYIKCLELEGNDHEINKEKILHCLAFANHVFFNLF